MTVRIEWYCDECGKAGRPDYTWDPTYRGGVMWPPRQMHACSVKCRDAVLAKNPPPEPTRGL